MTKSWIQAPNDGSGKRIETEHFQTSGATTVHRETMILGSPERRDFLAAISTAEPSASATALYVRQTPTGVRQSVLSPTAASFNVTMPGAKTVLSPTAASFNITVPGAKNVLSSTAASFRAIVYPSDPNSCEIHTGDQLYLSKWSSIASSLRLRTRIRLNGLSVSGPNLTATTGTTRAQSTTVVSLSSFVGGIIETAAVVYRTTSTMAARGRTYLEFGVINGTAYTTENVIARLGWGYQYEGHNVHIKEETDPGPTGGRGWFREIALTDPASGASSATTSVPVGAMWHPRRHFCMYDTDSTAANRVFTAGHGTYGSDFGQTSCTIDPDVHPGGKHVLVAATQDNYEITWVLGGAYGGKAGASTSTFQTDSISAPLYDEFLPQRTLLFTFVKNPSTGDKMHDAYIASEEWTVPGGGQ